eukprot:TRINITY_DN5268_c6_g1_i1.p1 TRINITY_DN5268_c6_g1~~TRINITY_DN5268_c6_g1_i1.p1  ORF type:complete len:247 (+),score=38.33 TRINITY_DN5268_c6_g1_i1:109-849(+)
MSGRLRGLQPSSSWIGDCNGRWINHPRDPPGPSYSWLEPCEGLLQMAEREGRRLRPARIEPQDSAALSSGYLPQGNLHRSKSLGSVGSGSYGSSGGRPSKMTRGIRPDSGIWPVGAPGPLWQPLSEQDKAWRAVAGSAVKAAAAARLGSTGRGSSQNRRKGASRAAAVQETPGVEAWDSISQAESPSAPGSPRSEAMGEQWTEVASAQTCQSSVLNQKRALDRVVREHMARNRHGFHEHIGGRFFG